MSLLNLDTPIEWGSTGFDWDLGGHIPFAIIELQEAMREKYKALKRTPHTFVDEDLTGRLINADLFEEMSDVFLDLFEQEIDGSGNIVDDVITSNYYWHDTTQDISSPVAEFSTLNYQRVLEILNIAEYTDLFNDGKLINLVALKIYKDILDLMTVLKVKSSTSTKLVNLSLTGGQEKSATGSNVYGTVAANYISATPISTSDTVESLSYIVVATGHYYLHRRRHKSLISDIPTDFQSTIKYFGKPSQYGLYDEVYSAHGTGFEKDKYNLIQELPESNTATRTTVYDYTDAIFNSAPSQPSGTDLYKHQIREKYVLLDWSGENGFKFKESVT